MRIGPSCSPSGRTAALHSGKRANSTPTTAHEQSNDGNQTPFDSATQPYDAKTKRRNQPCYSRDLVVISILSSTEEIIFRFPGSSRTECHIPDPPMAPS